MKESELINQKAPNFNTRSKISREKRSTFSSQKFGMTSKCPQVYIRTFGCQMNDRDSEEIAGMLMEEGYSPADSPEEADIVIFNTCTVRKHAEDRAISNIGALKALKKKRPRMIVGVVGCMAKAQGDRIIKKLPLVDFIAAPANIYEIPQIIKEVSERRTFVSAIGRESRPEIKNTAYHTKGVSALVTIMEGCNNFCSYCIVPYVRGREVSRSAADIMDEIKSLADRGYKEVTLLGQNVNSYYSKGTHTNKYHKLQACVSPLSPFNKYHKLQACMSPFPLQACVSPFPLTTGTRTNRFHKLQACISPFPFVRLLERINEIDGIERIRFLTSHPKDAGEDLFKAMRDLPKVCEHLHLPLQSGSDRILKSMNRGYTAADYLRKVDMLRRYVPDCAMTTDVIVGYPGETGEDFKATESLIKKIRFNFAFIFKYSPRPPAKASELEDDVPKGAKEERNKTLLGLQDKISAEKEEEFIGRETEVLVEGKCRKESSKLMGRNRQNIKVVFPVQAGAAKDSFIGNLKRVAIRSVLGHTLVGSAILCVVLFSAAFCGTAGAETPEEYFVSGDYENAVREGLKALEGSREKDKILYLLGTSLNKLGRYDLAKKNFISLTDGFPRSRLAGLAQLGIADSYYLGGDYDNAVTEYKKYITKYPRSQGTATAYFRLGKCAQKEGKWQEARNYYQKVRSDFPYSFEAQLASQALNEEILYFTVQVGSFNRKSNALKLCDELVRKGFDASIAKAEGGESYKVRVGKLNKREEAEDLAKKLRAEGLPTRVLP